MKKLCSVRVSINIGNEGAINTTITPTPQQHSNSILDAIAKNIQIQNVVANSPVNISFEIFIDL